MIKNFIKILLLFILIYGCAGTRPQPDWTATQYFHYALEMFNDEDYYEAANEFTVIVLRYPGSTVSDSAQFYLAESHFKMDEYIIAAAEYEKLINSMPRSPLVPQAQFRLAESYFELSPRPSLDQEYTIKSIREFQNFIEDYPTNPLREEAEKKIAILRAKLAEKEYLSAEIYRKMRKFRAAIIYYDLVLERYYDTEWADDAMYGKIITYMEKEDYSAARLEIYKFKQQFPNSEYIIDVNGYLEELPPEETQEQASESGQL
ncbi:MAG TPA: outer membrane protein assembly factor BamD [Caldithrix abyssi]|uniref:Outer membrane protein assembly factor BamD n=1 Tax=Caldithrix abyssi TaxID=187145 RepID=A0A7V4WW25_CALAY|nr:outer membrane protein assembly factor BamD [Caldithrix abyssi]